MCIRDRGTVAEVLVAVGDEVSAGDPLLRLDTTGPARDVACLLYTSDAADERSSVDLGGRRIIKKNNKENT